MGLTEQAGGPVGTSVRVEDLFYNVPARLKFLKRDLTERQQIDGLVTRYALAYPDVRFHLFHDGRPALQTSGNGNRREVLAGLYGVDVARQMLEVTFQEDAIGVEGFISPVALTRSNRREITFFVNGRWVQDGSLSAALLQAYHTLLMVGRYPICDSVHQPAARRGGRERASRPRRKCVSGSRMRCSARCSEPPSGRCWLIRRCPAWLQPPPGSGPLDSWQPGNPPRSIDPAWDMAQEAGEGLPPLSEGEAQGPSAVCAGSGKPALGRAAAAAPDRSIWRGLPGGRSAGWAVPD